MDAPHDWSTLGYAIEWLRTQVDSGARCPCCTQFAKVYRRKVNAGAARGLVLMQRESGDEWVHVPSTGHLARLGGEFARLRYWALIEESVDLREDGGRAGWWRITPKGQAFARNQTLIPKYARIYDGRCIGFDDTEVVSIYDALGSAFSYGDLMAGR